MIGCVRNLNEFIFFGGGGGGVCCPAVAPDASLPCETCRQRDCALPALLQPLPRNRKSFAATAAAAVAHFHLAFLHVFEESPESRSHIWPRLQGLRRIDGAFFISFGFSRSTLRV